MTQPLYNQAYIDIGDGAPVVLLHGLFGKVSMWKSTVDALSKHYRVIVPRLPLFELPADQSNISHLAELLNEFIEWHRLTDVNLVGHAMGGQVALSYAHDHPRNVDKIVLAGSSGMFESTDFQAATSAEVNDYNYIDEQVRSAFYRADETPETLVDEIYATIKSKGARIGSFIESSKQNRVEMFLNRLDHRVMLLWGLEDKITPPEVALHFHDFLQNSEVRFIEKCGHLPMIEEPELFSKHLRSFFA
jgi:pimeloyl-ACP methyl ester carboxylesterase